MPTSLVILTTIAVLTAALVALNMMHEYDTATPIAIVAAGGLLGLGIAARR